MIFYICSQKCCVRSTVYLLLNAYSYSCKLCTILRQERIRLKMLKHRHNNLQFPAKRKNIEKRIHLQKVGVHIFHLFNELGYQCHLVKYSV